MQSYGLTCVTLAAVLKTAEGSGQTPGVEGRLQAGGGGGLAPKPVGTVLKGGWVLNADTVKARPTRHLGGGVLEKGGVQEDLTSWPTEPERWAGLPRDEKG